MRPAARKIAARMTTPVLSGLLALALGLVPVSGAAQSGNPWRPEGSATPRFAPPAPVQVQPPAAAAGSYAPAGLDAQLSDAPRADGRPNQGAGANPAATALGAPPASGAVVPPYAGLPLAGGYGYGYVPVPPQPVPTIVVPQGGYPGYYGYPGSGYGYPGGGFGFPGWGNGWNYGNNNWNGWNPGGFGFPMGGFSPFGFW